MEISGVHAPEKLKLKECLGMPLMDVLEWFNDSVWQNLISNFR